MQPPVPSTSQQSPLSSVFAVVSSQASEQPVGDDRRVEKQRNISVAVSPLRDRATGEPAQSFLVRNITGGVQAPSGGGQPTPQLRQAPAGRLEAIRNSANRHSVTLFESAGNVNLAGAAAPNVHTPQAAPSSGFLPPSSSFHQQQQQQQQQQTQNSAANLPTSSAMPMSQQPVQMAVGAQQAHVVVAHPLPDVVSSNNLTRNGSAPNLFEQAAAAELEHQLQLHQAQHADRVSANSEESDEMAAPPLTRGHAAYQSERLRPVERPAAAAVARASTRTRHEISVQLAPPPPARAVGECYAPEIRKYQKRFASEVCCAALWGVNLLIGTASGLQLLDRSGQGVPSVVMFELMYELFVYYTCICMHTRRILELSSARVMDNLNCRSSV